MPDAPPLSVSLAGLDDSPGAPWSGGARGAVAWAASVGVRSVRLDAAAAGVRARELDRSARRDLAALLRRSGLALGGLDLWIPAAHFADASRIDRALAATLGAIDLAGDLAGLVGESSRRSLSLTLPAGIDAGAVRAIAAAGERAGVIVADHEWPIDERGGLLGVGIDPASVLLAGDDPAAAVSALGDRLAVARLSDANAQGRCEPVVGGGRLDFTAYAVAIETGGGAPEVVADLRGLPRQDRAARRMIESWHGALPDLT